MGSEAIWVPLALSALGAGASYYNTQQTAKKQDNALAQQIRNQQNLQHQADARTAQMIQQQGQQTDTKEKAAGLAANQAVLQANAGQAQKVFQVPGAVSQAYQTAGANAAQGITNFGNQQADLQSSINAPSQQRQNNRVNIDNYGNDLGLIARKASGQNFLDQLKLQSVRRNPWIDVGSGLLNGAAGAYGGSGGWSSLLGAASGAGSSNQYDYANQLSGAQTPDYLSTLINSGSYGPYGYLKGGS